MGDQNLNSRVLCIGMQAAPEPYQPPRYLFVVQNICYDLPTEMILRVFSSVDSSLFGRLILR